jgi:hypothetical protein
MTTTPIEEDHAVASGEADEAAKASNENWVIRCVRKVERNFQARRARKKNETPQDRAARRTGDATWWIAGFTLVSVCVGISQAIIANRTLTAISGQLDEMKTASGLMQGQLVEIKRQSDAAEKSATAGRAYLFIKPEFAMTEINPQGSLAGPYRPAIRFSIKNFGQTPAIITSIKTHLYLTNTMATDDPPEPNSPEAMAGVEDTQWAIGAVELPPQGRADMITVESNGDEPLRILVAPTADTGTLEQKFVFQRGRRSLQWAWFYCAITYQDIFGETRHTWLYARVGGTGFSYPKSEKYNHWD